MKSTLTLIAFLGIQVFVYGQVVQPTCAIYTNTLGPYGFNDSDTQQHYSGDHFDQGSLNSTCSYAGANNSGACTTTCTTSVPYTATDIGLVYPGLIHSVGAAAVLGIATEVQATGPVQCGAQFVAAVRSCVAPLSCAFSVTINASPGGIGGSVTASSAPLWTGTTHTYTNTCVPKTAPVCIPDPPVPPATTGETGWYTWDSVTCEWVWHRDGSTPIIIDTDGSGFHLTSAEAGIKWDFYGNGHPVQIAWTAPGSTNGWLAMPQNGQITSARQLFSNVAAQAGVTADAQLNGFRALANYDTDSDGTIDRNDSPWWQQLRVWIDSNHDGVAQPEELHTLDSLGITSISLKYEASPKTDQYGNAFRLRGTLGADKGDSVKRVIYDVTLTKE